MKISFIIPAYNASDTIRRCLNSVFNVFVDNDEFEVIVVDDCSSDNTVEIIKDYQSRYDNISLYCQPENHRQGAARNLGLDKAKGDYIVFLDSDDEIEDGLLSAVRMAYNQNLDMIAMRVATQNSDGHRGVDKSLPYSSESVLSVLNCKPTIRIGVQPLGYMCIEKRFYST